MLPFHRYKFSTTDSIAHLGVELDSNFRVTFAMLLGAVFTCYKIRLKSGGTLQTIMPRQWSTQQSYPSYIIVMLFICLFIYFFYRLPVCILDSLTSVHRTVARFTTGSRKYDHITGVMRKLHWLPVRGRIQFQFVLLTFKCIHVMVQGNAQTSSVFRIFKSF